MGTGQVQSPSTALITPIVSYSPPAEIWPGGRGTTTRFWRVRLEADNYTSAQITIGFGSTTDQELEDESFGIDNLSIVSTNDTSVAVEDAAGNDLLGGDGEDTLHGGAGNDALYGGVGTTRSMAAMAMT